MNVTLKNIRYDELNFKLNNIQISPNAKFDLKPTFSRNIKKILENDLLHFVELDVKIESSPEAPKPFNLSVKLTGIFEADLKNDDEKKSFTVYAVQVLFPYLRSAVTSLTALSNNMPLVLPLMKDGILFPEDANIIDERNDKGGFIN